MYLMGHILGCKIKERGIDTPQGCLLSTFTPWGVHIAPLVGSNVTPHFLQCGHYKLPLPYGEVWGPRRAPFIANVSFKQQLSKLKLQLQTLTFVIINAHPEINFNMISVCRLFLATICFDRVNGELPLM